MLSRSGVSDSEVLIRLDTSVLEGRLNNLANEWETDLKCIRARVETCAASVRSVTGDVDAIQRFLLSYHRQEMAATLAVHPTEASGVTAEDDVQRLLNRFVTATTTTEGSSTENLLGMVAVARRLLAENEALRTLLESATGALSTRPTGSTGLQQEVAQLRDQTTQQSAALRNITSWLPMLGLTQNDCASEASDGDVSLVMSAPTESTVDGHTIEAIISRSPLLLSLRQILLRDLTERLTSVVDQQSRDFHDTVAHLEDRLQRGRKGTADLVGAQSTGVVAELQETVRSLKKRLKDMDECAVKRDEFTSLMRCKADSLLMPAKADNASLTDLESRLVARCAELEERCAFADAERAEFRALLRSIIVALPHSTIAAAPSSLKEASQATVQTRSTVVAPEALLGEILPALRANPAFPALAPPSRQEGAPPHPRGASTPQQIVRVVGTSHGSGVHGVILGSAAQKEHVKPLGNPTAAQRETLQANPALSPSADGSVVAIGMTPTQGAYAAYVSEQLTRRHVASLPALPYERASSLQ
ncbi:hypothetical protein Q4I32_007208 [Leishmania shawi]|uniref:Uncharacterized protein n=1 Tax=Leishmania shawi TaxID=5680 RepID=A0AAW3BCY3_9TRYP